MKIVDRVHTAPATPTTHMPVVGRESAEAADLEGAIELARQLALRLEMPQQPDAMNNHRWPTARHFFCRCSRNTEHRAVHPPMDETIPHYMPGGTSES